MYSYFDGAPINLVDPTGNDLTCYSAGPDCSGREGLGGNIIQIYKSVAFVALVVFGLLLFQLFQDGSKMKAEDSV